MRYIANLEIFQILIMNLNGNQIKRAVYATVAKSRIFFEGKTSLGRRLNQIKQRDDCTKERKRQFD